MRVAIFTDNDFEKVNGVTTTLLAVLQHAPASLSLRVYTADGRGADRPDYFARQSIGLPIPFYGEMRMYLPRLREYVAQARADRVELIHLTTPGPMGLAALHVARTLRVPLVGSFHTDLAAYTTILSGSHALGTGLRRYMRWLYNHCERVLVPSESTRQLLIGASGDPSKIDTWTRGVDTAAFTPALRSETLRRQWRVSDTRPAILENGRVSREKGLEMLPDLQRRLRELGVAHRFIIAGQGPMLRELAGSLDDAVFTGVLGRREVARVFASADVFLFPSRTDTAGNVVLEAQASGIPVLVSDEGGPQENLMPDASGIVVRGTTLDAWTSALCRLLRDKALRARFAEQARAYGESRRWDMALQPLYRAYAEVIAAKSSAEAALMMLPTERVS